MNTSRIKHVKSKYIESGAFQGNEEDVSLARIEMGEECVVLKKSTFQAMKDEINLLTEIVRSTGGSLK